MRTIEKFTAALDYAKSTCLYHPGKRFWMVPTEDDYRLSCIKPEPKNLPVGTASVSCEMIDGEFIYGLDDVKSLEQNT